MADMFGIGNYFPPPAHIKRIARYRENKKLFLGDHYDVFERVKKRLSTDQREIIYVSVNMAGLISKKNADLLFGESPVYSSGGEDKSKEQQALERFARDNDLNITNYESALGNSYRGDSFYKIRWGQRYNGQLSKDIDPFRIFIEPQIAEYVYPETDPLNANNINAYHVAYPLLFEDGSILNEHDLENLAGIRKDGRMIANGDQWVLYVESHYPGKIVYRQFRMDALSVSVDNEVTDWKIRSEYPDARREVTTGVPFPLIAHVPNYGTGDSWEGLDDLSEIKPLLDELNNRLSLLAVILDKHSDPAMVVPAGSLEDGEDGKPIFHAGRDKVFEVMDKNEVKPEYITWDGQAQACFEEIKFLVDMILTVAEIPPVALGRDNSGTSGSSGLAIKFRMNSLLAKINRKRQYYDRTLRRVLLIAQLLEDTKIDIDYKITDPTIKFKDGLPDDEFEQAQIYSLRLGGKATISQRTALMQLDNLTEEQAEAEIKRMKEETDAEAAVSSSVFNEPDQDESADGTQDKEKEGGSIDG
jgi:hypothetical protein